MNPTNLTFEFPVNFSLECDQSKIYVGEQLTCSVINISNSQAFVWNFHDGSDLVVLDDSVTSISHTFHKTGTYYISVVGYNTYNLSSIETMKVEVLQPFPSAVIKTNTSLAYEDEPIQFSATNISEPDDYIFSWEFGDKTTKVGNVVEHSYSSAGHYVVRFVATTPTGLTQTEFLNVTITNYNPIANVITRVIDQDQKIASTTAKEDQTIEFDATRSVDSVSDIEDLDFLWNFGDSSYSNKPNINHTFAKSGSYDVQLKVSDDNGDVGTQTVTIFITNESPILNDIQTKTFYIDEGQTFSLLANASDTMTDKSTLEYEWSTGQYGWLTTVAAYDNLQHNISLEVTDDDGANDISEISLYSNNVAPTPSLQQIFSYYNITFAIMGEKWHNVNITLSNTITSILDISLFRTPGDPWENNVTFAYLDQDVREKWKLEILYSPEDDPVNGNPNGANPVSAVMHFDNINDNYTLKHTFNVQQPETYNWTFYVNPIQWGFPLDFKYHVFDPGSDDITVYTDIDDVTYNSTYYNEGTRSTEGIVWSRIRNTNITSIQYYAVDDDGGISDTYNLQLVGTDPVIVKYYAPIFRIVSNTLAFEDEIINFEGQYLTPGYSNDSTLFSYTWHFGDFAISNLLKSNHFYENSGEYLVWLEASNDNLAFATGVWIEITNKDPTGEIGELPFQIVEDQDLNLVTSNVHESLSDRFNLTYYWEISTGQTSSNEFFEYSFPKSGVYTISLSITDDQGATSQTSKIIEVENADPILIGGLQNKDELEGNTLHLTANYADSDVDALDLTYNWNINDEIQVGKSTNWYLQNGIYPGTLNVYDTDGGWSSEEFFITIENKIATISSVDYSYYGNTTGSILVATSISGSYFDHLELSNNVEYCLTVDNDLLPDCVWKGPNKEHFYENITITNAESNNYNVRSNVRDVGQMDFTQTVSEFKVIQDSDGDELIDELELMGGTNPFVRDTDEDNIADPFETAIYVDSPISQYAEYSRLVFGTHPGDFDTDNDGLPDGYLNGFGELISGTDPLDNDTDDDNLLDGVELHGWDITVIIKGTVYTLVNIRTNPLVEDTDQDGLSDAIEFNLKSNPLVSDTDQDGLDDFRERQIGTSLVNDDTDFDNLSDFDEVDGYLITWYNREEQQINTTVYSDPWRADTDDDGLLDGQEFQFNTNAASRDTDEDGLTDSQELSLDRPTLPYMAHSDDDGLFDGLEVNGWNITTFTLTGARYNEFGDVTLIQPVYTNHTELITTDPWKIDTDGDFVSDGDELIPSSNSPDSSFEASNPTKIDSDGDGLNDRDDSIPLMSEFQPPEVNGNMMLEYKIPLLSFVEDVIKEFKRTLSNIAEIISDTPAHLTAIWNLIQSNPFGDIRDEIDNYIENLAINYAEDEEPTFAYLGDTIDLVNFNPQITAFTETIREAKNFALNIISGDISLSEAWDRVKSKIWNAGSIILDYAKDLASNFADKWLRDRGYEKDGSNWISFQTPGVDIDWKHCGPKYLRVICGIDDIDVSGGFKINFKYEEIAGLTSISIGGYFTIDFVEILNSVFGVLAPTVTLEFDVYDAAGIDRVDLWINSVNPSGTPYYSQSFSGDPSGHFQWQHTVDLTEGCRPDGDNGDDNGGGSGPGGGGGGGGGGRVLFDSVVFLNSVPYDNEPITHTLTSHSTTSTSMTSTSSTCEADLINEFDFVLLLIDVNGNQRQIDRTVDSFPVQLLNQAYEIIDFTFPWIGDAVEWVASGIETFFEVGQQVVNDIVEGVETIVETAIELIESAFRWVWENFVMNAILTLKAQYYDPAKEFVDQSLTIALNNKETEINSIIELIQNEDVNNTLNNIDDQINQVTSVIEPVANVANAVSSFISQLFDQLGPIADAAEIVIEAFEKLKDLAMQILTEVIQKIVQGIFNSVIGELIEYIDNLLGLVGDSFEGVYDSMVEFGFTPEDQINIPEVGENELLNPLSSLTTLLGILTQFPNIKDIHNTVVGGLGGALSTLIELISDSNRLFSLGQSIGSILLTPIISIVFVINDIFGLPIPDFSDSRVHLSGLQFNQASESTRQNIISIDSVIVWVGLFNEVLSALKEIVPDTGLTIRGKNFGKDSVKLIISIIKLSLSVLDLGLNIIRKDIIVSELGDEFDFNNFIQQKIRMTAIHNGISILRDAAYLVFSGSNLFATKSITYVLSMISYTVKLLIDANDLQTEVKHAVQYVGYPASMLEQIINIIRNLFKAVLELGEIAEAGSDASSIKEIKTKFAKLEAKIRFQFMTIIDVIEDVFNVLAYDYLELS